MTTALVKTDCSNFPLDRPCIFQKDKGARCDACNRYIPMLAKRTGTKKLLIIKLGAMGDVLRTTFLLPGLKKLYPDAEISWIVASQSIGILQNNPYLARTIPLNDKTFDILTGELFDIVINLDLAPASLSLATMALASRKIGYTLDPKRKIQCSNRYARQWLSMSAYDDKKKGNQRTYQYWMAKITGLSRADYEIHTPLDTSSVKKAAVFSKKFKIAGKTVVGINPGAGKRWPLKKWTDAGYGDLIRRLSAHGAKVLLLGGPEERDILQRLQKQSAGKAISAGTDNPLNDFFALLNLCDMVVTGDTLAMHAALGLKKKVVAIFGPTSSAEIELYGRGMKVVTPAACACCYRPNCGKKPDCMELISPDAVWDAVQTLLPDKGSRS